MPTDRVKTLIVERNGEELDYREELGLDSENVFFDDTNVEIIADNVQVAIQELDNKVLTSASPGYSWGKSGNSPANTYLNNEGVSSNISGRYVYIFNAKIKRIFTSNQNESTYDIGIYYHYGNEENITYVGMVSILNKKGDSFEVDFPIPTGSQIALRILNGSVQNIVAGAELEGTKNA